MFFLVKIRGIEVPDYIQPKTGLRLELAYLHGGEMIGPPGGVLGPRVLSDFELVYVIDGEITYSSGGTTYTVPSGGCILGRPGTHETYQWDPQIPTRHAYFHFGIECYPSDWPPPEEWPRICASLSSVCVNLFRHILQHIYEHDNWPMIRPEPTDCRLVEGLMDIFIEDKHTEMASFDRERPEPVQRALVLMRRVVEENPLHALSLAEVAAHAHVTEKHLCRLFTRSLGHSPMQTLTLLKLQSSRSLLMRTNLRIKEVAVRCGFENPFYFSRRFSQAFGCSPTAFRDQLCSGKPFPVKNALPLDLTPRARW